MTQDASINARIPWEMIGAAAYVTWGLWHLQVVVALWRTGAGLEDPGLGLRLQQGAFHILFFALVAVVVGAWLNRRNSRLGYWINLVTVGWTEVGLFYLFILPGLFPWLPKGWVGPAAWCAAVAASTAALVLRPTSR